MSIEPHKITDSHQYDLVFFDDFSAPTLDHTKWIPFYLPQWSSRRAAQPRFTLDQRGLTLEISPDQQPWCPEFNGNVRVSSLQTGVYAGALNSSIGQHRFNPACRVREVQTPQKTYTPLYGYFEIKAKCRLAPSNVAAFWMIGYEDQPAYSAEICIFELKGQHVAPDHSIIGFGVHPFSDPLIRDEFYEESYPVNTSDFNCYAAEWTEHAIHFYLNGSRIKTIHQSPHYPMQFMLNIYDLAEPQDQHTPMECVVAHVAGYELKQPANTAQYRR